MFSELFIKNKVSGPPAFYSLKVFFFSLANRFPASIFPSANLPRPLHALIAVFLYWLTLYFLQGLTQDHILLCGFFLFLYYWKLGTRRLALFLFPMILSGIVYDSMRYYADYIRGPVHVAQPYLVEKALFGLHTGPDGALQTPNEFWQAHTHWSLDLICGLAYIVFIFEYFFLCLYFFFSGLWEYLRRASWSFFWVNLIGYATYYLYAAAPPWYVELYGLGPARMDTQANPAGAARFDALLGTHFFTGMYGRSADVFGAIPSLHVSYPFMAMIFSLQMRRFRPFSIFFFFLMCFSAVYLNHHYLIDVILGILYASATLAILEWYYKDKKINPDSIF